MTLEEEITVDLTIEEMAIEETAIDSAEETDLDPALQETIELLQDKATTMISEDDQERDPDLVAEMHLHTVETGIEMTTDMLSEEAWLTTEAEAQTENRAAEDLTMTEEASFQTRSHTARDHLTEEKEAEAVADMTTTTDGQWEVNGTDSKEDRKAAQMASNTAATGRESTTVTVSTAIKRVTSLSTAALLEESDHNMVGHTEVAAVAAAAAEATITIGKIEDKTIPTLTVRESVEYQPKTTSLLNHCNTAFMV